MYNTNILEKARDTYLTKVVFCNSLTTVFLTLRTYTKNIES